MERWKIVHAGDGAGAAKRGMKVIAFTDHSASLGVTGGLKMEDHKKQAAEIKKIQKQLGDKILVLHA